MSGGNQDSGAMTATRSKLTPEARKWVAAFCGIDVDADAQPSAAPGGGALDAPGGPPPLAPMPPALPAAGMKDEEIAAEIMDKQLAILEGWRTALTSFDKVMTSSSDSEATPDFQKVVVGYFADKLLGWMEDKVFDSIPGGGDLKAIGGALAAEAKRAQAAGASATLRDFIVQHVTAVGKLIQAVLTQRQGFVSAVRAQREAVEAPRPAPKAASKAGKAGAGHKKGQAVLVEPTKEDDDYAMMRMVLMDTLARVDAVLKVSTPEALFRVLSEEWVRSSKVGIGMGIKISAVVVIRLSKDYKVLDAHIQGAGGQKLAEQLLKDSPDGVELLSLKAPKRILLMAENGWPSVTLSLDANNRDVSTGSFGEGNTGALLRVVMSKGLPPAKKLTGD